MHAIRSINSLASFYSIGLSTIMTWNMLIRIEYQLSWLLSINEDSSYIFTDFHLKLKRCGFVFVVQMHISFIILLYQNEKCQQFTLTTRIFFCCSLHTVTFLLLYFFFLFLFSGLHWCMAFITFPVFQSDKLPWIVGIEDISEFTQIRNRIE